MDSDKVPLHSNISLPCNEDFFTSPDGSSTTSTDHTLSCVDDAARTSHTRLPFQASDVITNNPPPYQPHCFEAQSGVLRQDYLTSQNLQPGDPGEYQQQTESPQADILKTDLCKTDQIKTELIKIGLSKTDLSKADLFKTDLRKADLCKQDLYKGDTDFIEKKGNRKKPSTWLITILSCLALCMFPPIGLIAIITAVISELKTRSGQQEQAYRFAHTSIILSTFGIVVSVSVLAAISIPLGSLLHCNTSWIEQFNNLTNI